MHRGACINVIGRGIEKRRVFWDDVDRAISSRGSDLWLQDGAMDVYAWALMPNHFHLLCKTRLQPLSISMHRLLTVMSSTSTSVADRHGHLFRTGFKSIVCQEDRYLKELCDTSTSTRCAPAGSKAWRRSRIIRSAATGRSWAGCVVRGRRRPRAFFVRKEPLHGPKGVLPFRASGAGAGRRPELVGGGLVRSMGGWSEVLALRHRGEPSACDPRILERGQRLRAHGSSNVWMNACAKICGCRRQNRGSIESAATCATAMGFHAESFAPEAGDGRWSERGTRWRDRHPGDRLFGSGCGPLPRRHELMRDPRGSLADPARRRRRDGQAACHGRLTLNWNGTERIRCITCGA